MGIPALHVILQHIHACQCHLSWACPCDLPFASFCLLLLHAQSQGVNTMYWWTLLACHGGVKRSFKAGTCRAAEVGAHARAAGRLPSAAGRAAGQRAQGAGRAGAPDQAAPGSGPRRRRVGGATCCPLTCCALYCVLGFPWLPATLSMFASSAPILLTHCMCWRAKAAIMEDFCHG